ncbi:hypothetical protein B4589_011565 [Halolamina sp. CBA1230]|uniref:hypothetical protein n=1 Tax=Halolamina sp. CBA1230 TaxID=1853690 RepID=UPI0009A22CCE|nr:hypothetical protein [Halolamina sp. CBA1230]QKY20980.1 hypothetical protein B4589_011565 [Halolamina sp. CBA1230]
MSSHLLLTVQTAVLIGISLAVLYPVVAYSRSVLHTEAIVALALSTFAFTVGSVIEQALGRPVVAEGIYLLSAVAFGLAVWLFAREFVRPGETAFGVDDDPEPGSMPGFADASEEPAEGGFADASEEADGE